MDLLTVAVIALAAIVGLTWAAFAWVLWRWHRNPLPRPFARRTLFERELQATRDALTPDDVTEYDRIMGAIGVGQGTPPQVDVKALRREVRRRFQKHEIGVEQYRAEIRELARTYTFHGGRPFGITDSVTAAQVEAAIKHDRSNPALRE